MTLTQENRVLKLTTLLGADYLLLESLDGSEGLSKLFSFDLELLHEENSDGLKPTAVDPHRLLGQSVTVQIKLPDKTERFINGIVNFFAQRSRNSRFTNYQARVVPHVWLLTQRQQSRIFQQQSVPNILRKVLAGFEASFELQGEYGLRDYCVQYRETDWDFASRLMEDEGIYYYFAHQDGSHKIIVADSAQAHRECPSRQRVGNSDCN